MGITAEIRASLTCGEACWAAREDVCRCSCGGVNHGCNRDESGERPQRTRRVGFYRYKLVAVGDWEQIAEMICNRARDRGFDGADSASYWHREYIEERTGYIYGQANQSQIDRWPELASYRGTIDWDDYFSRNAAPFMLWERA